MSESLGMVVSVARRIVYKNSPYYDEDLLELLPEEIRHAEMTDENLYALSEQVDQLRFAKQGPFAQALGLSADWMSHPEEKQRWSEAMNGDPGLLTPEQAKIRREIKFLLNVGCALLHQ